jgi:hypothetical protein
MTTRHLLHPHHRKFRIVVLIPACQIYFVCLKGKDSVYFTKVVNTARRRGRKGMPSEFYVLIL